ncbi:MAG: FAD-dependent oxidoreductase [Candidatus Viridilinea halotolerans]|uniref:FAD-dependent oxidoreductase n=1 Tax=Candidatus Viridilinea halotolerans TaxID=2491704 RepID=A0A426TW89_9CHLR|nr:MAG: FAD-dependent oxidoreductase [Candidatus Viridilinea halotolerans]
MQSTQNKRTISIAIVGAGVAGLAAGRALTQAGHTVSIFEKSRGVGGRLATRRVGDFCIDHGAQLIKAPSASLLALVQESGSAYELNAPVWTFDGMGRVVPGDPGMNTETKWVWQHGNNAFAQYMAQGLNVSLERSVAALLRVGEGYEVVDTSGERVGPFEVVLLTAPAPQSAAVLAASDIDPDVRSELLAALQPARYRPCISLALAYPQRPTPPWYALVNTDRLHPITWLACEHAKPGRTPEGYGLMLAQMAPAWSQTHWEALAKETYDQESLIPAPVADVHTYICGMLDVDLEPPLWVDIHRWRYALADTSCGVAASAGRAGIFVAGDMELGQGRAHLAISSGWAAARRIGDAVGG